MSRSTCRNFQGLLVLAELLPFYMSLVSKPCRVKKDCEEQQGEVTEVGGMNSLLCC